MMPDAYQITLPWPPSVNHYWTEARWIPACPLCHRNRLVYVGRKREHYCRMCNHVWIPDKPCRGKKRTPAAVEYCDEVVRIVNRSGRWDTFTGPLDVEIRYQQPNRIGRDAHNFDKGILDALERAKVFENDRQVAPLRVDWDRDDAGEPIIKPPGSAIVTIRQLVLARALFAKHGG